MNSNTDTVIHWFRQDLRLQDNPALNLACQHTQVLPIYILDSMHAGDYQMGAASQWWLHHSLNSLNASLDHHLSLYHGSALDILNTLIRQYPIKAVYWNRCYEPWRINRDKQIKEALREQGIKVISANGSLLWEPWEIQKNDGTHYKVFTPFYRKGCLNATSPRHPEKAFKHPKWKKDTLHTLSLEKLKLLPTLSWDTSMKTGWQIGEQGAHQTFEQFLQHGLQQYKEGRNFPAKPFVSKLSPYLHFGEISPNQVWYKVRSLYDDKNTDHFCSELGWREFSYSQLYHHPNLPTKNLQNKFDHFPWTNNLVHLKAWQKGQTGIPMVDAGMRELWQTGYMHNRVRMVVGSFLVKNLRIHWHYGERWFWDCLVDADLANNSASWQWIAGCGADAAPYFRIFNPITQGQKFDPDGQYTKKYLPELAYLPNKFLFNPWEAPECVLHKAGVQMGQNYPYPIVDLQQSRASALAAFQSLK